MPRSRVTSSWTALSGLLLVLGLLQLQTAEGGGQGKAAWNDTWMDRLRHDLFDQYSTLARPAQHNNTTTVTLGITVTHLDIDEINSVMVLDGWTKMSWKDEKLKWNAPDYGGLTHLHVADSEVWKPDVVLYNNAAGSDIEHYGHTNCILYADGTMLWVPPSQFRAYCDLDLRRWPRDLQTCTIKMGSWTHNAEQINLQMRDENNEPESEMLASTSEWELVSISRERHIVYYACCPEPYADITFTFELRRRSPSFFSLLVMPAAVVVVLTLAGFWLSPQCGERVILNALTALIICDLQRAVSQKLPDASGATPYILLFYSSSMALSAVALVVSVAALHLSRSTHSEPPSAFIRSILTGTVGRLLCLPALTRSRKDGGESLGDAATQQQAEWMGVARSLDRLGFYGCAGVFLLLGLALI